MCLAADEDVVESGVDASLRSASYRDERASTLD